MGIYEAFKDVLNVAKKADNIDLYRQLLDLSAQALDMQAEIAQLKEENMQLRRERELDDRVVHHKSKKIDGEIYNEYPYITLLGDTEEIRYCAICWGKYKKLIPLYDELNCNECLKRK